MHDCKCTNRLHFINYPLYKLENILYFYYYQIADMVLNINLKKQILKSILFIWGKYRMAYSLAR